MTAFHSVDEIILKQSRIYDFFFLSNLANIALFLQMYLHAGVCLVLGAVTFFQWWKGASGPLTQFLSTVRDNETSVQIPCDINFSDNILDDGQQGCWIGSLLWIAPSARYETFKWETAPSRQRPSAFPHEEKGASFLPAQGQRDDLSTEQQSAGQQAEEDFQGCVSRRPRVFCGGICVIT